MFIFLWHGWWMQPQPKQGWKQKTLCLWCPFPIAWYCWRRSCRVLDFFSVSRHCNFSFSLSPMKPYNIYTMKTQTCGTTIWSIFLNYTYLRMSSGFAIVVLSDIRKHRFRKVAEGLAVLSCSFNWWRRSWVSCSRTEYWLVWSSITQFRKEYTKCLHQFNCQLCLKLNELHLMNKLYNRY